MLGVASQLWSLLITIVPINNPSPALNIIFRNHWNLSSRFPALTCPTRVMRVAFDPPISIAKSIWSSWDNISGNCKTDRNFGHLEIMRWKCENHRVHSGDRNANHHCIIWKLLLLHYPHPFGMGQVVGFTVEPLIFEEKNMVRGLRLRCSPRKSSDSFAYWLL